AAIGIGMEVAGAFIAADDPALRANDDFGFIARQARAAEAGVITTHAIAAGAAADFSINMDICLDRRQANTTAAAGVAAITQSTSGAAPEECIRTHVDAAAAAIEVVQVARHHAVAAIAGRAMIERRYSQITPVASPDYTIDVDVVGGVCLYAAATGGTSVIGIV